MLGSRRGAPDRVESGWLLAIASASSCPVVIVPADWRADAHDADAHDADDANDVAGLTTEPVAASGLTAESLASLCAGTVPVRIVPTPLAEDAPLAVSG